MSFLGLSIAYGVKLYVSQNALSPTEAPSGSGWATVELRDAKGRAIADVSFLFPEPSPSMIPMKLGITHSGGTQLDSLRFSFEPDQTLSMDAWLKVPGGYPWNPIHAYKFERNVIFDIPDLGFQGSGSVPLDLFLQPIPSGTVMFPFRFRVYLTLHNTGSILVETRYLGGFVVPFAINSSGQVTTSGPVSPST